MDSSTLESALYPNATATTIRPVGIFVGSNPIVRDCRILCDDSPMRSIALIAASFLFATAAQAGERPTVAAVAATDLQVAPTVSGFGLVLVQAEVGRLRVRVNTDTLDVSWGEIDLAPQTSLRVGLAGEALVAGMMHRYSVAGEVVPSRGFAASWAGPYVEMTRRLGRNGFAGWRTTARQWWFGETEARAFTAPENFLSLEQKISLTYWGFAADPSLYEPHRLFRRIRGFGAGVQGEFWWRTAAEQWGNPADGRNEAHQRNFGASQWAAVGVPVGASRVQVEERAYFGVDQDDLNRLAVGGFNPYMIRLPGVSAPAFRTSRALSGEVALHMPIGAESELGLTSSTVLLHDPLRDGTDEIGALTSVGAFVDFRSGPWQADLRFGWTLPSPALARVPQLGLFAAIGRQL